MAQSRLEKIGTIFTRVSGLLRSGAMKPEDKPIWYDVYAAFPPKVEPRFDRPAPQIAIKNIFYEEDKVRAKFHKSQKQVEMISMFDRRRETQTQQFIKIYQGLKSQGALDEEKIFETSMDLLQQQRAQMKIEAQEISNAESEDKVQSMADAFSEAKTLQKSDSLSRADKESTKFNKSETKSSIGGINIENLFKD
ncbi:small ribosomal subunit protein mS23 [Stomoxys calcitrans]|uniref:Small ribosomal subunit protein mS23 n=1 Tax=Stomoxys calcitrans TaxID=35570 RepID=A0A1I8Q705_STOCA|nr:small ribosomal subunit protein mS23 [Stomoxys calcitrans]